MSEVHVLIVPDRAREVLGELAAEGDALATDVLRAASWAFDCDCGKLRCLGCRERLASREALPVVAISMEGLMHAAICFECSACNDVHALAANSLLHRSVGRVAARSAAAFGCEQVGHA